MNITDTAMRYTVAVIVTALLIGLGYASFAGKKQDEQLVSEQGAFYQALQYIQDGKSNEALPLLQLVDKENSNSAVVKYYLGSTYASMGNWNSAVMEYQKTLDLNPYKVEDSIFMFQFASILISAEKLDAAKVVLERCQTLPAPEQMPDYQEQINALLMQTSSSL